MKRLPRCRDAGAERRGQYYSVGDFAARRALSSSVDLGVLIKRDIRTFSNNPTPAPVSGPAPALNGALFHPPPTLRQTTSKADTVPPSPQIPVQTVKEMEDDTRPAENGQRVYPSSFRSREMYGFPPHPQCKHRSAARVLSTDEEGCLLDRVGWHRIIPELIVNQMERSCDTIVDPFCGLGDD